MDFAIFAPVRPMPRYHTSIPEGELDRIIAGDRPTIDMLPFLLRHQGKRQLDSFILRCLGMTIRGTIEQRTNVTVIELRPQRTLLSIVVGVLSLFVMYTVLFLEELSINGEPATLRTRLLFLPVALLIPAGMLGFQLLMLRGWIAKLERDMKLQRLP